MKECRRRRRFDTDSIAGRCPLDFSLVYAASSYPPSPPRRYVAVPFVAFFEAAAAAPQFCFMVRGATANGGNRYSPICTPKELIAYEEKSHSAPVTRASFIRRVQTEVAETAGEKKN